jgi:2-iminobutanoate/2-iminopropanoate deaminase
MLRKRFIFVLMIMGYFFVSYSQENKSVVIFTSKAPKPIGPYSQGILSGNTLYISGQIAIIPETGKIDTSSVEVETQLTLKNIGEILFAAGMTYKNVVKVTIYTTDIKNFAIINKVYSGFFIDNPPARETIQVSALPAKAHIEISAVAIR